MRLAVQIIRRHNTRHEAWAQCSALGGQCEARSTVGDSSHIMEMMTHLTASLVELTNTPAGLPL